MTDEPTTSKPKQTSLPTTSGVIRESVSKSAKKESKDSDTSK